MAIDRGQIGQAVYFGRAVPAGPLSPALKQWSLPVTDFSCYRSDPAAARKALEQAGVTLPLKLTLNVLGSLPTGGRCRAGRAGATEQGRVRRPTERAGTRQIHRRLARQQFRGLRFPQRRQPRPGRLLSAAPSRPAAPPTSTNIQQPRIWTSSSIAGKRRDRSPRKESSDLRRRCRSTLACTGPAVVPRLRHHLHRHGATTCRASQPMPTRALTLFAPDANHAVS